MWKERADPKAFSPSVSAPSPSPHRGFELLSPDQEFGALANELASQSRQSSLHSSLQYLFGIANVIKKYRLSTVASARRSHSAIDVPSSVLHVRPVMITLGSPMWKDLTPKGLSTFS